MVYINTNLYVIFDISKYFENIFNNGFYKMLIISGHAKKPDILISNEYFPGGYEQQSDPGF